MDERRLSIGDRVRHMMREDEGVIVDVRPVRGLPGVVVRLDAGGNDVAPMGDYQALPGYGSTRAL